MIPLEIEQKYRVATHEPIIQALVRQNARAKTIEHHRDVYLRHPCRDFAVSGEVFRLRHVNHEVLVTYKGPKEGGPVKTRSEIELPLTEGTGSGWMEIFQRLGFIIADEVTKIRTPFEIVHNGLNICVTCDVVESLGTFVEVEAIATDRSQVEFIQNAIVQLANNLGLKELEPRSYLRQILELKSHVE